MIKLYIRCLVLIIRSVEVGPDMDMKFHQVVMKIVSYDMTKIKNDLLSQVFLCLERQSSVVPLAKILSSI